jgi:PEP-CTERM motif
MTKYAKILAALSAALILTAGTASADLVTNGGFETGDFTGWTNGGNTGFTGVNGGDVHSGTFSASFGPVGSIGTLTQTLATQAGATYDVNFWLANEGGPTNSFAALFDGNTLTSFTDSGAFGYVNYDFQAVASGTSTVLEFDFRQDPSFIRLDDVSVNLVRSVPEPGSALMLGLGATVLGAWGRRRHMARKALA